MENNLSAPSEYWNIKPYKKPNYINGCGGSDLITSIVPDNLIGLDISHACFIHDYTYEQGKNRKQADKIFLKNMMSLINQEQDSIIIKSLRKIKAYVYYQAVRLLGKGYFSKKN